MDERFVVHTETNGVRQVGYILMSRTEATLHLEADRAGHESDGWQVAVGVDRSSIVMTKGASTRRIWLERHTPKQSPYQDERDIRQRLARGFEYSAHGEPD